MKTRFSELIGETSCQKGNSSAMVRNSKKLTKSNQEVAFQPPKNAKFARNFNK